MRVPDHIPRLTAAHRAALDYVGSLLRETAVVWVLTGSTAFAMRGVDVVPRDIDIQTDAAGAYAIQRLLAPDMVWPVRYRTSSTIRSHFGRAVVEGTFVEIMGALEKRRPDGAWMPPVDVSSLIEWLPWDGLTWPVLPLDYEIAAYRALGRAGMADLLVQWMADQEFTGRDYDEH